MRPLHVLLFRPCRSCCTRWARALFLADVGGGAETIKAYRLMGDFNVFGIAGLFSARRRAGDGAAGG